MPVSDRIVNSMKDMILTNQSCADLFIIMSIPPNRL
jgi:hypothetical protein